MFNSSYPLNSTPNVIFNPYQCPDIPMPPPTHLPSDYVEMGYLTLVICVGTPLNILVLSKLISNYRTLVRGSVKAGFVLLKINVNITDLMLLDVYCLGRLGWLASYEWLGGNVVCKLYQTLVFTSLYASSNIVVCISLDRLRNVILAQRIRTNAETEVRVLVACSWGLAVLWSLPQMYLWEAVNVIPCWPQGFVQCANVWDRTGPGMTIYNLSHLLLVFWIPLLLLAVCYSIIAVRLFQYSRKPASAIAGSCATGTLRVNAPPPSIQVVQDEPEHNTDEDAARVDHQLLPKNNIQLNVHSPNNAQSRSVISQAESSCSGVSHRLANHHHHHHQIRRNLGARITTSIRKISHRHSSSTNDGMSSIGGESAPRQGAAVRQPAWRRQLRSRVFRTTLLIVLAHVVLWFPYQCIALSFYVAPDLHSFLSDNLNIFKALQILITLVNPFLYGLIMG